MSARVPETGKHTGSSPPADWMPFFSRPGLSVLVQNFALSPDAYYLAPYHPSRTSITFSLTSLASEVFVIPHDQEASAGFILTTSSPVLSFGKEHPIEIIQSDWYCISPSSNTQIATIVANASEKFAISDIAKNDMLKHNQLIKQYSKYIKPSYIKRP